MKKGTLLPILYRFLQFITLQPNVFYIIIFQNIIKLKLT